MPQNRFWELLSKKLAGEASLEDLQELEQLIKIHPELVYAAEQIGHLWKQDHNNYGRDAELAFQAHLNHISKKGIQFPQLETPLSMYHEEKPRTRKKIWLGALASILLVSTAFIIWKNNYSSNRELLVHNKNFSGEISTRMGNRIQMILPDSTVVWLNAGSKLTYNEKFGIDNRNTTLSGEAYFDVRKSTIPFTIQANAVHIKVLGTAFNVKSYPGEKTTETSLVRGSVEVTVEKRPGVTFTLKPNEKLVVSNDIVPAAEGSPKKKEPIFVLSELSIAKDSSIIETSWKDNKLIFEDESFAEIAVKMERWYGVEIEFRSDHLVKERISGTFTKENIYEALKLLQMTTPFQYTMNSNIITITQ